MSPADLPLRDIHLPPPPGWWPPAPGWWALAGLLCCALALAGWVAWRRRTRVRRAALRRLREIEGEYRRHGDVARLAGDLSTLLRRALITVGRRGEVAGLTGDAWLAHLDRGLPGSPFSTGPGRCLAEAPYRPADAAEVADAVALIQVCRTRLRRLGSPA